MEKATKELAEEAGIDLRDGTLGSMDELEDFRRLVIENERECAEAVGVTASLPGTNNGYTFVAFNGSDVPVGIKLFTFPPAAIDRDSVIEEMAKEFDSCSDGVQMRPAYVAIVLRALKSQPAAPDPRDEALMLAKALLENLTTYDVRPSNIWRSFYASSTGDYVNLREVKEQAKPVLAAIDKVMKEGK